MTEKNRVAKLSSSIPIRSNKILIPKRSKLQELQQILKNLLPQIEN